MKSQSHRAFGALLLLAGIIFGVLNVLTPLFSDDFMYRYIYVNGVATISRPITSCGDIAVSQIDHYFHVNGRTMPHVLAQLFAGLLGKGIFNIANAMVFMAFIAMLSRELTVFTRVQRLVLTLTLVLFLLPTFNNSFLWMSGALNYLWSATFILAFIVLYRHVAHRAVSWHTGLFALIALLAGWTHEALSMPLALGLVLFELTSSRKIKSHPTGSIMIACFAIGSLLCALAPSTLHRAGGEGAGLIASLPQKFTALAYMIPKLRAIYIAIFVVIVLRWRSKEAWRQLMRSNGALLTAIVLSAGVVLMSGFESPRAAWGLEFYAIILIMRALNELSPSKHSRQSIVACCALSSIVLTGFILYYSTLNYREDGRLYRQFASGHTIVSTQEVRMNSFMSNYVQTIVMPETDSWYRSFVTESNRFIAATYHCDSLAFVPKAFLDDIVRHRSAYDKFHSFAGLPFYAMRINGADIPERVLFNMRPAEAGEIPFYLRPVANRMVKYTAPRLEASLTDVLTINGDRYLLVGRNRDIDSRVTSLTTE